MSQAQSGHGATIAIEQYPIVPGSFTVVAELVSDIKWPGLQRNMSETTPHQDGIDSYVPGRLGREPLTFTVNYIYDDPTHDHLTGLQKHIIEKSFFGVRILGPNGGADDDEIIASGFVESISHTDPVREGARSAEVTIRLSKRQKIDGVFVGTAA